VLDLPHSDACYVRAYPAAVAEAWVDGHIHAFAFFGAVPQSIVYDNDRCLVAKILPDGHASVRRCSAASCPTT
jgi:transposase